MGCWQSNCYKSLIFGYPARQGLKQCVCYHSSVIVFRQP
jgi:hypothetical protein